MARRSPDRPPPRVFASGRRRLAPLAFLSLSLVAFPARPATADQGVVLVDLAFQPGAVTIEVGETVTWEHRDGNTPHSVTSTSGPESWDSNPTCTPPGTSLTCMTEGETFPRTFDVAGTYEYHCKIHSQMTGTVVVEDAAAETTTSSTTTTTELVTTTTAVPETSAPSTAAPGGEIELTPSSDPLDEEAAASDDDTGGGGAVGLAVILITLAGVGAFLVWRLRPKAAIVVDAD